MSVKAVTALFGALALALAAVGLWTATWWPFAGAVGAAAVAGYALTEPPPDG